MVAPFIPVNQPLLNGNEKRYLVDCIDSGWISSEGPYVEQFEQQVAQYTGQKYGIAVCNGSAALDAALLALDLSPGDEVILPTFTIISCVWAIIRAGATPVLVDSDPLTWNMVPDQVAKAITTKTKAILAVHIYGLPVDMDPLLALAQEHKLWVIEDAAEALGQTYKGRPCGGMGQISVFSFYANKQVTTGEGGMLVTSDETLAQRCKEIRNLAFQTQRRFLHEQEGFNFRMTNMQAALGVAQMERLESILQRKREIGRLYQTGLSGIEGLTLPCAETDYASNLYWVFGLVINRPGWDAHRLAQILTEEGIGTRPFFIGMHRQPVFKRMQLFPVDGFPIADCLAHNGLYLPSGLALEDAHVERVINTVKKVLSS